MKLERVQKENYQTHLVTFFAQPEFGLDLLSVVAWSDNFTLDVNLLDLNWRKGAGLFRDSPIEFRLVVSIASGNAGAGRCNTLLLQAFPGCLDGVQLGYSADGERSGGGRHLLSFLSPFAGWTSVKGASKFAFLSPPWHSKRKGSPRSGTESYACFTVIWCARMLRST